MMACTRVTSERSIRRACRTGSSLIQQRTGLTVSVCTTGRCRAVGQPQQHAVSTEGTTADLRTADRVCSTTSSSVSSW